MSAVLSDSGLPLRQDWAAATAAERATLLLMAAEVFTRRLQAIDQPSLWLIHDANQMTYSIVTAVRAMSSTPVLLTAPQLEALARLDTATVQEILRAWLDDVAHAGSAPAKDALSWLVRVVAGYDDRFEPVDTAHSVFGFASPLHLFRPHAA